MEHIVLVGQIVNNDNTKATYSIDKQTGVISLEFDLGKIKYLIETISGSIKAKAYSQTMATRLNNIRTLDLKYKKGIEKIIFSHSSTNPSYSFEVALNIKNNTCSFHLKRVVSLSHGTGINEVKGKIGIKRKD